LTSNILSDLILSEMKKFICLIIAIYCVVFPVNILALEDKEVDKKQNLTQELNSFELFWPISAGKTVDDPIYWIKNLKEKIRGFLIFGDREKADYYTLLTVKRIVEAEKLIKENKVSMVNKTLENSLKSLAKIESSVDGCMNESVKIDFSNTQMETRLLDLENFIPQLIQLSSEDNKKLLESNLEKIKLILSKI